MADPAFAARCREAMERFRDGPAMSDFSSAATPPPAPPHRGEGRIGSILPIEGRGNPGEGRGAGKRVRVNRDRKGGWTTEKEARFVAALAATWDVALAAASAGMSPPAAFRRRMRQPGFAKAWREALRSGEPWSAFEWLESAECFFAGAPPPPGNPVRITSLDEVIRMVERAERRWIGKGGGPPRRW